MASLACFALGAIIALWPSSTARADAVTLAKDRSAIARCRIQIISGGRVFLQDEDGRLREVPLVEVQSLRFDDVPPLVEAEPLMSGRQYAEAIPLLLRAVVESKTNAQRIWALSRLSLAHAGAGQFVEAAGHAASVYALDDSPYWTMLEPEAPESIPLEAVTYAAAAEAMDRLQRARAAVSSTELRASVDRMTVAIQPVYRKLVEDHGGEPFRPNATLSGIPIAEIRGEQAASKPAAGATVGGNSQSSAASAPALAGQPPAPPPPAPPSTVTAEAIDAMLDAGDFAQSIATCEAVAKNPGERDLALFLYQYGRSLHGGGRTGDAAVMFARCAVLFAGSPHADLSLVELANIYATDYNKPDTARRLLHRAIDSAAARGDSAIADVASSALDALADHASDEPR